MWLKWQIVPHNTRHKHSEITHCIVLLAWGGAQPTSIPVVAACVWSLMLLETLTPAAGLNIMGLHSRTKAIEPNLRQHMCCCADAPSLGRQAALFSVVVALTRRLRAVFVPYFRYMMDGIVAHLGGSHAAGGSGEDKPKKKKKRQSLSSAAVDGIHPFQPLLCFRVTRKLHPQLLHSSCSRQLYLPHSKASCKRFADARGDQQQTTTKACSVAECVACFHEETTGSRVSRVPCYRIPAWECLQL